MEKEKLGQEPAFPLEGTLVDKCGVINFNPFGMSKRFYAACAAMQGMLAGSTVELSPEDLDEKFIIEESYRFADELLKQENQ